MNRISLTLIFVLFTAAAAQSPPPAEPLHERIDLMVEAAQIGLMAPLVGDAEFLRRVYLDLVGKIPSATEARAFLEDQSPQKRNVLIEQLLDSPRYARHWSNVFDVILMERRGGGPISAADWQAYLHDFFVQGKPYDQLVREILSADGTEGRQRRAANFYLNREGETHKLTRDIGRIFFGRDLQCAQCHDHPLIDEYFQSEYYGLYAFLNRSFVFKDESKPKDKQIPYFAELAVGEATYKSVFIGKSQWTAKPRLPGGEPIEEPSFTGEEAYLVKPTGNVRPVPKYSRRIQLANMVASGRSEAFNRNIVNRLWTHMMGHGLVEPVDLHHSANPASHPQLLEMLGDAFKEMGYDIKALLRELALSRTYQRSVEMEGETERQIETAQDRLPPIEAEQQRVDVALAASQKALSEVREKLDAARKTESESGRKLSEAEEAKKAAENSIKEHETAKEQLAAKQKTAQTLTEAAEKTKQVAEKLSEDKEFAAAAATIKARADKLTAEAKELATNLEKQAAAAKGAADKMPGTEQVRADAAAALEEAKKQTEQSRLRHVTAQENFAAHQAAKQEIQRQLDQVRHFNDFAERDALVEVARSTAAEVLSKLQAARQAVDDAEAAAKLPELEAALGSGHAEYEKCAKALEKGRGELATKEQQVKSIVDTLTKAEAALEILPDDAGLKLAAEKLQASRDQLTTDVEPFRQNIANLEGNASKFADAVLAAQDAFDVANAQIQPLRDAGEQLEIQADMAAQKMVADKATADASYDQMTQMWSTELAAGSLKPLSPEQLAWSLMQAVGMVDRHRGEAHAELTKKAKEAQATVEAQASNQEQADQEKTDQAQPQTEDKTDPAPLVSAAQLEQAIHERLKENVAKFVRLFAPGGGEPQQDFFVTVDQALFFANAGEIRGWIKPGQNNLTERLNKIEDFTELTRELYLIVLTRRPTELEVADVENYLVERPDGRSAAIEEIVWALLTSTEFRFNH